MQIHTIVLNVMDGRKNEGFQIGCICGWDSGQFVTFGQLADDYNSNERRSTICKKIFAPHGDQFKEKNDE